MPPIPSHLRLPLAIGLFLLAHLCFGHLENPPMWGLDMLAYTPLWVEVAFVALALLLLLPAFRRSAAAKLAGVDLWAGAQYWIFLLLLTAVGLAAFVGLRTATHLLGDGDLMLRELSMQIPRMGNEPLALWILRALYLGVVSWGASPEDVYRFYSYASGLLYLLIAFVVTPMLGKDRVQRLVAFGLLLTPGYLQLFCGYVENYPLLFPGMLLYFCGGLQYLRGRLPLWAVSCMLALLMVYHFIAVTLAPSLLILVLLRLFFVDGGRTVRIPTMGEYSRVLFAFALVPVLVVAILKGVGLDLFAYAGELRGSHFLPLWGAPSFIQAYRLLTPAHLLDFLNEQLLVAPGVALVLLGIRRRRRDWSPERLFLLCGGLVPLAFTFLANPEIGLFRDWDVLAVPALPLTLWAALASMRRLPAADELAPAGLLICGAAGLHILLWIGVNADREASVARFVNLVEHGYLSSHAQSYGWESLGGYYRAREEAEKALHAYLRAAEARPHNPRHWETVGESFRKVGRLREAVAAYERAVKIDPQAAAAWDALGTCYGELGQNEQSIQAHREALQRKPYDAKVWYNLGNAYMRAERWSEAAEAYGRTLAWRRDLPEAHINLGLAYSGLGDWNRAEAAYQRALQVAPDYGMAHYSLARLYARSGDRIGLAEHARHYLRLGSAEASRAEEMRQLLRGAGVEE